jgi:menaquinol-cytochrome c reductase iron-sulfur subunit
MAKSPESQPSKSPAAKSDPVSAAEPRRGFMTEAAAIVLGGIVGLFPVLAGLAVFLDPLRRTTGGGKWVRLTSLDSLPSNGTPSFFPVIMDKRDDAWTRFLNEPVGSVYLIREGEQVKAFSATCPHAGCCVAYLPEKHYFQCPCHTSAFDAKTGDILTNVSTVPPRGMDELKVKIDPKTKEVSIEYQEFYTGLHDKKAKA